MFNKFPYLANSSGFSSTKEKLSDCSRRGNCEEEEEKEEEEEERFPRREKAITIVKRSPERQQIDKPNCLSSLPSPHPVHKCRQIWQRFKVLWRGLCVCGGRKRKSCNKKLSAWRTFRRDYFGNVPVAMEHLDASSVNNFPNIYSTESEKLPHDSSPPPPYNVQLTRSSSASLYADRFLDSSSICSMETAGSDQEFHGRGETPWCKILYWEGNERKGSVFPVLDPAINVLGDTPHGSGLSLAAFFGGPPRDERIRKTRRKICQGLVLWREGKVVWVYNRSEAPVYLNSASLDGSFFNLNLYKCPPGYAMIIYYYEMAHALMGLPDYKNKCLDKADVNSVRISFAKGWGKNYHRREILCCPCWIEVHVVPTLKVEQLTPPR